MGTTGSGEPVGAGELLLLVPEEAQPATPFCITGTVPAGHVAARAAPEPLSAIIPDTGITATAAAALAQNFSCFIYVP